MVVAGDGTRYADVFGGIDHNNLIAKFIQAGFIQDGGFEEEEWWID